MAFQQSLQGTRNHMAHKVGERLISTAEMLMLLLGWIRESIAHIFDEIECPTTVSVP
jgi:hypothetical protein